MFIATFTVALLLNAQSTPYLVLPKTRPELRSSMMSEVSSSRPPTTNSALQSIRSGVLDLVNQERRKRTLPMMKQNSLLDLAAQHHAEDMAKRGFFSHQTPDGRGPEDRIRATGYFAKPCECSYNFSYGENIAKGQKTPRDVMKAWMNSKIHRENILKPDFNELGVGYAGGMWVENFGGVRIEK